MGFDFPNLPYLIDGNVKISESSAIPRYISQKIKRPELFGKEGFDQVLHAELLGVLGDIRDANVKIITGDDAEKLFKENSERVYAGKIKQLEKFLGDKEFLLGYFTYADLELDSHLYLLEKITEKLKKPSLLEHAPKLKAHIHRFFDSPKIKEFREKNPASKFPFLPPAFNKLGLE